MERARKTVGEKLKRVEHSSQFENMTSRVLTCLLSIGIFLISVKSAPLQNQVQKSSGSHKGPTFYGSSVQTGLMFKKREPGSLIKLINPKYQLASSEKKSVWSDGRNPILGQMAKNSFLDNIFRRNVAFKREEKRADYETLLKQLREQMDENAGSYGDVDQPEDYKSFSVVVCDVKTSIREHKL